jgi:hypothetical protein
MKIVTKYTIRLTEGYHDGYRTGRDVHELIVIANSKEEAIAKAKLRITRTYNNDYLKTRVLFSEDVIVSG